MASFTLVKSPLWMQNVNYPAVWDRTFCDILYQEGVFPGGGVVAAATGLDITISPFRCVVTGDEVTGQGKYLIDSESTITLTVAAVPDDRTEYVYVAINDPSVAGGRAGNNGTVVTSATLPTDSVLLLATIALTAGLVTITNPIITDQRIYTGVVATRSSEPIRFRGYGTTEPTTGLQAGDVFFKEA